MAEQRPRARRPGARALRGPMSAILAEVVHRLMTIEACQGFGWPVQGIARRLRHHPVEVQQLMRSCQAVDEMTFIGLDVLPIQVTAFVPGVGLFCAASPATPRRC